VFRRHSLTAPTARLLAALALVALGASPALASEEFTHACVYPGLIPEPSLDLVPSDIARVVPDGRGFLLQLKAPAREKLRAVTAAHVGERMTVKLDGEVLIRTWVSGEIDSGIVGPKDLKEPLRGRLEALARTLSNGVNGARLPPIRAKNARARPAIVAVRSVVADVESAIRSGRWSEESYEDCAPRSGPSSREERMAVRDPAGQVRRYVVRRRSADSSYALTHWYDAGGRLRFAEGNAGAVDGPPGVGRSFVTYRLYFTEDAKLFWQDRGAEGPFRPWLDGFQRRMLVHAPGRALATKLACGEEHLPTPGDPLLDLDPP